MPIFGFVLTLAGMREAASTLDALAREPGVTLAANDGRRIPVVLELEPHQDPEARVDGWRGMPAVLYVDYAFADFDDLVSEMREEKSTT